jgi:Fe-Mn family superoxide dismutase
VSRFRLPPLSFDYGALEPHISGRIMELHHDKHHRAYVEGANKALDELADARERGDLSHLAALEQAFSFNASGHVLHSMLWHNLAPGGGGEPDGDLGDAIRRDFGSFEACKGQLVQSAATLMGSGWSALAWEPLTRQLITLQIHDHHAYIVQGASLLLVVDAWEHAYYLQYRSAKPEYLKAIWNVVNWADVMHRFDAARRIDPALPQAVETAPRSKIGSRAA